MSPEYTIAWEEQFLAGNIPTYSRKGRRQGGSMLKVYQSPVRPVRSVVSSELGTSY